MKRLAIIGGGGHGKVVADCAELLGWNHIQFFDDLWPDLLMNEIWPVSGKSDSFFNRVSEFDGCVVAIGNNRVRLALSKKIIDKGFQLATLIHPSAIISRYSHISNGTVVFAGAVINPGTKIGIASIINTSASVDHDCILGDAVHISPGAHIAGGVTIGDYSWIGIGASIKQTIHIGNEVIVGAGAAVVKNVATGKTVIGVPAVEMRSL